jgi:hypothetical protein
VLVVLVVLVAVLVVADRVAAWVAGRTVADQVATELASHQVDSAPPEVSFHRVPFLTQVAAGRYESVTLRLREVGSSGVKLSLVELNATGVTASATTLIEREGPIEAERVTGTATVGYASVTDLAGMDGLSLSADGDGGVRVRLPADLLGVEATLAGTAEVTVDGGVISLRVTELAVEEPSGLPGDAGPLLDEIAQRLSVDVPLPPLPYGLSVESVRAAPSGLAVTVTATDVPLAGSGAPG